MAWLFLRYRQPVFACEAVRALHRQGYAVSPLLAAKLLAALSEGMEEDTESLVMVLEWLSGGILAGKRAQKAADERMLETVFEILLRLGREDWLAEVFRVYRSTLEDGEVGSSRLWGHAITASARNGDVGFAKQLFREWRTAYFTRTPPRVLDDKVPPDSTSPPSAPYLALLTHYAEKAPNLPPQRDPAYVFLAEVKSDNLAPSTALLNTLLRVELHRNRFSSFWGVWRQFGTLSIGRSPVSWVLAIQAKLKDESTRMSHRRGRARDSPLLASAPFPYREVKTPAARALFRDLLTERLAHTNHRPSRRLPTTSSDALTPDLLNSFLDLFVARHDLCAATVVLETFAVHRLEPNARTHGSVVVGVVKQWERGRLRGRLFEADEARAAGGQELYGTSELERLRGKARRTERIFGGGDSLAVIRKILERRKVRAGLWAAKPSASVTASGEGVADETAEEQGDPILHAGALPVETRTELRDLGYLVSLLRRAQGMTRREWTKAMHAVRREMLPKGKKELEEEQREGDEQKREA
ncbi:hypothetical protein JCM10207_004049 [Rhodosporidiobolus poonsookiae]